MPVQVTPGPEIGFTDCKCLGFSQSDPRELEHVGTRNVGYGFRNSGSRSPCLNGQWHRESFLQEVEHWMRYQRSSWKLFLGGCYFHKLSTDYRSILPCWKRSFVLMSPLLLHFVVLPWCKVPSGTAYPRRSCSAALQCCGRGMAWPVAQKILLQMLVACLRKQLNIS